MQRSCSLQVISLNACFTLTLVAKYITGELAADSGDKKRLKKAVRDTKAVVKGSQ